jgi:2-polyprenyl-6-methoxyphenol hydroxylase-like FAD-dependent oxidoreductase
MADNRAASPTRTDCCIAGCGPAGAVLGLLLARAGVDVTVLEKHGDFLRDFRGDTIHPSTLELLDELGLASRLLRLPHSRAAVLAIETAGRRIVLAELERLRTRFPYIVFLPQWDFLSLVTSEARRHPRFHLLMEAEVDGVIEEDGAIRGVRYRDAGGPGEIRARLTVAADGRSSAVRAAARMEPVETSAPMDVLWFRLARLAGQPEEVGLRTEAGHSLILINRSDYWQAGYVIPKGGYERLREAGLESFKADVSRLVPELAAQVAAVSTWDEVKLLTVRSNRLRRWSRPGLLCIGDSAHAMSPVGGVGINLAIQDAVVAANVVAEGLRRGEVSTGRLLGVQLRREIPVRVIQGLQRAIQAGVTAPAPHGAGTRVPAILGLFERIPALRVLPARLIGIGVWRVHARWALRSAPALLPGPEGVA